MKAHYGVLVGLGERFTAVGVSDCRVPPSTTGWVPETHGAATKVFRGVRVRAS